MSLGSGTSSEAILSEAGLSHPSPMPAAGAVQHGRSPSQIAFDRLRHDRVAMICFGVVVFFVLIAIFAPLLAKLEGQTPDALNQNLIGEDTLPTVGATSVHWFGIEPRLGRDLFARWVYGARPSLIIGVVAATASTAVGVALGLVAGYLGGGADKVITWVIDFVLSLPFLLFVIAVVPITEQRFAPIGGLTAEQTSTIRFWVLIIILVIFGWAGLARLIRGEVISLREREFIAAARVIGVPTRQILFKELLPNLVGPIIVSLSIAVPAYISLEATLSFLGAGLVEPTASWGRTIDNAQNSYAVYPLYLWPPVIGVVVLVLALSLLGDAVRDAFDPNTRR
jgi:ABC-type dipeptide/oligopeptide/nickel transport system permease subunit